MIPIKRVKRVSFSILSSKDIQEMAVMQVRSGEATENKIDTLYDLRMGTTSDDNHCQSCGLDVRSCPGHPGYVYLTRPVYNVLFLHQIAGILKSTCFRCGGILVPESKFPKLLAMVPELRLKKCEEWSKKITVCQHCSYDLLPVQYVKQEEYRIFYKTKEDAKLRELPAEYVLAQFHKLKQTDIKVLGFYPNHPKDFIFQNLYVPPPAIRPPIITMEGATMDDNLHKFLSLIVKKNKVLQTKDTGGISALVYPEKGFAEYYNDLAC